MFGYTTPMSNHVVIAIDNAQPSWCPSKVRP
jgi:hypothetical protein